jgi:predicted Fe-Mo cluster-binding NifX family protein
MIIAGGMGVRAQQLFTKNGIQVQVGAPVEKPETIIYQSKGGASVPRHQEPVGLQEGAIQRNQEKHSPAPYPVRSGESLHAA